MPAHARRIEIVAEDRPVLEKWAGGRATEHRLVGRAQIVLLAGEGRPASEIAARVGCSLPTVKTWRSRYALERLDGLRDLPKSGRPLTHGQDVRAKLIALACTRPPDTPAGVHRERWTHRGLAQAVGMSESQAHDILRSAGIRPHLTEYWVMSELGPDFDAQAAVVCGLCVDAPENAIVVSIDLETSTAAGEAAGSDGPTRRGEPAGGVGEYLRSGTTNLFAALQGATAAGTIAPAREQWDLIEFLARLETEIPDGQRVIAILDNLSTRNTQAVEAWLLGHPRWERVFAPTHASWLHQVEIFCSILTRRLLEHAQLTGSADLAAQMLAFVEHHNLTGRPFAWTPHR